MQLKPGGRPAAALLLVVLVAGSGPRALEMSPSLNTPTSGAPNSSLGQNPRQRMPRSQECSASHFLDKSSKLCCQNCPAGHFLVTPCSSFGGPSSCQPCRQGTYLPKESYNQECFRCQECDKAALQVAIENCSATGNTRCGCAPGWFKECSVNRCEDGSPFSCRLCPDCHQLHRLSQGPNSAQCPSSPGALALPRNMEPGLILASEAFSNCGPCFPGFYEDQDGCSPCPTKPFDSCPQACAGYCSQLGSWVPLTVTGLMVVLLLLGGTLTYCYWKRRPPQSPIHGNHVADEAVTEALAPSWAPVPLLVESPPTLPALATTSSQQKVCDLQLLGNSCVASAPLAQEAPCPEDKWLLPWSQLPAGRGSGPAAGLLLQPGPQLYDVMDAVPARRWKEFVRTLGLREAEIEAVEVEVVRFRDQQYEMLKRWRQQQPAGLGAVYAALERMGLDGCAEELRKRLQRGL
ncbi:tumor necrosis factor receptor superfamily member 25 [Tachyglossus aculeatus]|uniref:tumor necrosis factor receptor superfamily member 25 n=1 Tax=Tachyglossus aculeatus TaxID=9261 RepID=UPI0018F2BE44|nr:tumor necrosis factor receptor superfamily member 25 [Tachyglossus aculeatus]